MDLAFTLAGIVGILLLIGASAFFSSSELAIFSLASHRIDALAAGDGGGAAALARLREDPHRLLVTVLVGNNVANIAAASVATALLAQVASPGAAVTGATVFTSCFVLVIGEIAPKSYAVSNAEPWALRIARPLSVVQRLMSPVVSLFEIATDAVNRVTGGSSEFESYVTREDVETIVVGGEAAGALDAAESTMIRGVLDLEATTVRSVMVPRVEMVAVPLSASPAEVIDTCAREGVTLVPVYGENRDDVRGIVDLREAILAREDGRELGEILLEPRIVPATKPVDELLAEMRDGSHRMVIVVDEFGAVVGLATLEDVVEEIVGEIFGRGEVVPVRVVDGATALVRGWATIDYLNESFGVSLPTDRGFGTVAGLIHDATGSHPEEGDRLEIGDVALTVVDASPTRIHRIRVERIDLGEGSTGESEA